MYFGADYHPEHWVHPYAGTAEEPEARWKTDIELMVAAGMNTVRMGEFVWGLCEPVEGEFDFSWLKRVMDLMAEEDIKVVLATPTAAPPIWLTQKHPDVLPRDERGLPLCEGTRHACCLNSDLYWSYAKKIVRAMAEALGHHPQLIAWQIDNNVGAHSIQPSFNEETRRDWHSWLQAKYETLDRLNDLMGTRFWGQTVRDWSHVPMPRLAPAPHNPALMLDWRRFYSDTIVAFVRMQAEILREITPHAPVTTNIRAFGQQVDLFDVGEVLDFVSLNSNATTRSKSSENACEVDLLRSLKKSGVKTPSGDSAPVPRSGTTSLAQDEVLGEPRKKQPSPLRTTGLPPRSTTPLACPKCRHSPLLSPSTPQSRGAGRLSLAQDEVLGEPQKKQPSPLGTTGLPPRSTAPLAPPEMQTLATLLSPSMFPVPPCGTKDDSPALRAG